MSPAAVGAAQLIFPKRGVRDHHYCYSVRAAAAVASTTINWFHISLLCAPGNKVESSRTSTKEWALARLHAWRGRLPFRNR